MIKTINLLRQEMTGHRQSATGDLQYLQRTIFDLETLQRNYMGACNARASFYEIRGLALERTERLENMMAPLLPTTRENKSYLMPR